MVLRRMKGEVRRQGLLSCDIRFPASRKDSPTATCGTDTEVVFRGMFDIILSLNSPMSYLRSPNVTSLVHLNFDSDDAAISGMEPDSMILEGVGWIELYQSRRNFCETLLRGV